MRLVPTRMQWVGRCTGPTQELEQLKIENPFSIRVMARDSYQLTASLDLPDNHAYEGKQFDLAILVPDSYPFSPPEVHFITPIYHINVTEGGVICMEWAPGANDTA
ncbi:MAG: uncharacterized protein KVP18_001117 [Porospora cf. gigantea A]|uniref:uncharacterized protein n=1 Tax=Porospora cf. gigantea A TaxID=2853593 RepID=UPI00355A341D|nr:MAG: hypothetical protein KVP18_001117 [Porospora cf. gigantea A]